MNIETNPLDSNYENITNKLSTCKKVIEMMETDGWKEIVAPRIHNMIREYTSMVMPNGLIRKGVTLNTDECNFLRGEASGMINIFNMIASHETNYELYKNRLDAMEARAVPRDYKGAYE